MVHTATPTIAVQARELTKCFGEGEGAVTALGGIAIDVFRGELLMLVGPSGCGKTTLLSVVAGIMDKTSGSLQVLGQDPSRLTSSARASWRATQIGFVFQSFNLIPALTVTENVAVPLLIQGIARGEALRRARAMVDTVKLSYRAAALPAQLSGGQQQRVAIARALIHQPPLIVCDEPTSALDHETGTHIMQLLKDLTRAAGCTLIVVTHDARIFHFADRIVRMDDGKVLSIELGTTALEVR